jgi:hypothetical protein
MPYTKRSDDMKKLFLIAALSLPLVSCATPETRIRTALINAGLPKPMSACMADRMVNELSLLQLNKLRGLQKLKNSELKKTTFEQFVKRTRSLQDPEIMSVVTSSGVTCSIKAIPGLDTDR